jgi:hypothetical protein
MRNEIKKTGKVLVLACLFIGMSAAVAVDPPTVIYNFEGGTPFNEFLYFGPGNDVDVQTDICTKRTDMDCAIEGRHARWFQWNLGPTEYFGWGVDMRGFNARPYNFLVFYVKGANGGERFKVKIKDKNGLEIGLSSLSYGDIGTAWQQIVVPLKDFTLADNNLQLGSLENINIGFNTLDSGSTGKLSIDYFALTKERPSDPTPGKR